MLSRVAIPMHDRLRRRWGAFCSACRVRHLVVAVAVLVGSGAAYPAYCGLIIWSGNFHVVDGTPLYRSAQLTKDGLRQAVATYQIRSVLNLRGAEPDSAWYNDERETARALGIAHYDIRLSARRSPAPGQVDALLAVLQAAPKPLLIHCKSGADRSGLVAALYRYAILQQSADQAGRELSLRYGHFPYLASPTSAMDTSFRAYVVAHPLMATGLPAQ